MQSKNLTESTIIQTKTLFAMKPLISSSSFAPLSASSSTQHISFYSNVTHNNCKGKLIVNQIMSYIVKRLQPIYINWQFQRRTVQIDVNFKLFLIINLDSMANAWQCHNILKQMQSIGRTNQSIGRVDCFYSIYSELNFRLVCVYIAYHCLSLIMCTLALAFTLIILIVHFQNVNAYRFAYEKKQSHLNLTTIFQSIEQLKIRRRTKTISNKTNATHNKCNCFNDTNQWADVFDEIASTKYFQAKKQVIKQQYCAKNKRNVHMFDSISMKSMDKKRFSLHQLSNIDPTKCYNSVLIVRMVQIVMSNDKNATALTQSVSAGEPARVGEPIQQHENTTNVSITNANGINSTIPNGDANEAETSCPVTTIIQTEITQNAEQTASTSKANTSTTSTGHFDEISSKSSKNTIQSASTAKATASSNKKSNVIMVKRSKLKNNSNGVVPMPVFRSMNASTSKSTENRTPPTTTSVIIMNKLGQTKQATNANKTELYEMPARTNHLLRILNSPPKPINTSPLPTFGANLERTISGTQVTDFQKTLKVQTTVASDVPTVKSENVVNMDQSKLQNLLNDQNGNKKINNNLFICKTEGKVIRLTPLMSSNCFNNVTTTSVQPTTANEIKVIPDLQKNVCPIILEKKDSKSPPPLTLAMSVPNSSATKTSPSGTRSIFEEIYAKFMNTKDAQEENMGDSEKKNGATTTLMTVDDSKVIKSGFYSIPTSHAIMPSKQQTTFLQCQPGGLVKSETFNAGSVSTTFTSVESKSIVKPTTVQTTPAIYLKHVPKTRNPPSKTGLCEILVTNENDLKVLQKTGNDSGNLNASATIANPSQMNQIHIFPLIASNGRNVAISSTQTRTSCVRPQVIITGANTSNSRTQKIEPEKRSLGNLVDQLREFDMVMEQIKEERNTNETTDKLMLNNLSGILNHHIIDSGQMRSVALPQKINLAIIKKGAATGKAAATTKPLTLTEPARTTSTPVVVVTNANVSASKIRQDVLERVNALKTGAEAPLVQTATFDSTNPVKVSTANVNFKPAVSQPSNQNAPAKHPQKTQEDEQTVQRIYDILAQYAEQISTSPDLNNKPAPRRRSNLVSIQSSPITSTGIRMVSSKSSFSSSTSTVGSIISSSSNSNSSNESYQGATINESRKRTTSLQNDDLNGSDCASNIDTITIQQPVDKKRRISNINLDGNDFILTTLPSLSTYATLPKSSSNEMLKSNNQIIITTTNAQHNTEVIPATIKQDGELLLTNVNANLTNGATTLSTKLKPLSIGVKNSSGVDPSVKQAAQSPAILLPGVSVVVSTEQNLQHTQAKITNSNSTSGETARICGFTAGIPYKINIAGANKCRPFKQYIPGQSYRNDNYILPMSILKYGKSQTVISEQQKMNQIVHPNVATVMIPSANVQRDLGTNVKIVSDTSMAKDLPKTQHIQFNIAKKPDNFTPLQSSTGSTLLLRTLSGTNIGGIQSLNKKSDDTFETICEQLKCTNDNSSNLLPTFTSIKTHQSDAQPLVESIQLPSQIFQSNRGILILDSNKYATLLTTNCTIPTTTAPIMSETKGCLDDIKSSNAINEPKITTTTSTTQSVSNIPSVFSKIDLKVPMCDSEDDFLLENGLNVDSPKCDDTDTDETYDDLRQTERIFSLKALPTLFGGEFSKSSDDILDQNDHTSDVIDDTQELIYHQHDKSSDNVVIIDKQKSDSLTLNSVSSETRMNARTNSIIERELRLQKSLSEECEDLGVESPSTSDLFPDAFISF